MNSESAVHARTLDPPPQFSLRAIFIVQAVFAMFLAIMVMCGIFCVPIALVATLIFAAVRVRPERLPLKRLLIDLLGGVLIALLCLYYDPIVFTARGACGFVRIAAYSAMALQMAALLVWLFARWRLARLSGLFAGMLFAGAVLAFCCGLVPLPLSVAGVSFLVGAA
jgi:hypothetical protein